MIIAHKNGIDSIPYDVYVSHKVTELAIAITQNPPRISSSVMSRRYANINPARKELPTSIKPMLTVSIDARISKSPAGKAKKAHPPDENIIIIRHRTEIIIDKR